MKRETRSNVSVEPLPKQGCEMTAEQAAFFGVEVSVEPLPKQGCEGAVVTEMKDFTVVSVEPLPKQGCENGWNDRRRCNTASQWNPCRSRGARRSAISATAPMSCLSGTPAEAGVRGVLEETFAASEESQWNPCRSRGASCRPRAPRRIRRSLSGTPAEAGVRVEIFLKL